VTDRSDPSRRTGALDLLLAGGAVAGVYAAGALLNAWDRLEEPLRAWPHMDELLALAVLSSFAWIGVALRRSRLAARAERLRREAELQLRSLLENLPAIAYIEDARTRRTTYVSPQIETVLGFTPDEWLASPTLWTDRLHPDDRDRVVASDAADEGDVWSIDYRMLARDGRTVWLHNEAVLVRDERGEPRWWQGIVTDITERKASEERLARTEERLRRLLEDLPVVVYVDAVDELSTALYVGPRYQELTGYSPEERLRQPDLWLRMLHPEDRERVIAESRRTNETGEPFDMEYRIVTADGRVVWVRDRAYLVTDADGRRVWQGVLIDITDRYEAALSLARRDRILHATAFAAERLLSAEDWSAALDEVLERLGTAAEASRATLWRNDRTDDDLVTTLVRAWHAPGIDWPEVDRSLTTAFSWSGGGFARWAEELGSGRVVHERVAAFPPSERALLAAGPLPIDVVLCVPIFVAGRWWGYVGLDRCGDDRLWKEPEIEGLEIGANALGAAIARAEVEARVREAEERFRGIVEHIPAAVYLDRGDDSMQTLYVSPQIEAITGITPEAWVAEPDIWVRAVHPADRERVVHGYLEAIRRKEAWRDDYRVRTPDGRTVWVHDETTFLRSSDGGGDLIQGVLFDITERKLAEQALRDSERREREAADRLRALDEMKNTFLAAVSHELRSPLTSILGLALTLERAPDLPASESEELLRRLAGSARKLDRLLRDLLDIDRLNRGIVEPQRRLVDVGRLARQTCEQVDALAGRQVILRCDPTSAEIDPAKVERIVENLLTNAARHTGPDHRIWLRVGAHDDGVLIVVEDDGPGIPEPLRRAIFEPFRQGPSRPAHAPGTGIGLTLVARFAELHGGRAWVEEREGGGASFRVWLPRRTPTAGGPATSRPDGLSPDARTPATASGAAEAAAPRP
jgi:PAS domain S-box-containing protein